MNRRPLSGEAQYTSLHTQAVSANFLPVAAATLLVIALFAGLFLFQLRAFHTELALRGQSLADALAYQSELALWLSDEKELSRLAEHVATLKGVFYVVVETNKGERLATVASPGFPLPDLPAADASGRGGNREFTGRLSRLRFLDLTAKVQPRATPLDWENNAPPGRPIGVVRIGLSTQKYHTLFWRAIGGVSATGLLSLALILAVQRRQMRRVLEPLKNLIDFTRRVSSGDLASRATATRNDEIGQLAAACNEMVRGLEHSRHELLHALDAAQESSRLKSEFLANMSHEIRTPLNGMIGMTELALDADLPAEPREQLNTALHSANALMDLLNDILDLSKIEAGKLDWEETPFDPTDVVEQSARGLAVQAHLKGVEVVCDIAPDLPRWVAGDPGRLRQVLSNLIGNAIKFTSAGEIVVAAAPATAEVGGLAIRFSVSDTGIGIPSNKREDVFEPFTQADGSTARQYGGTGLGLAICSRLAARMGGSLAVESEVGKGSTFQFTALFACPTTPAPPSPACPCALAGKRVLLADDNGANRRVLTTRLRACGMDVVAVSSGAVALSAVQSAQSAGQPFPVAILDAVMPGMDGFETANGIQRLLREQAPALILLRSCNVQDRMRSKHLPGARFLTKPAGRAELCTALRQILAGPQDSSPDEPAAPSAPPLAPPQPLSILVAEDNSVNRHLIESILRKAGHTVHLVSNGSEAVSSWSHGSFDLILMDVQMPGVDGYEATRRIRELERPSGSHIPIIALTAHALKGDREQCLSKGMDHYVTKPINRALLFEAIAAVTQTALPSL